MTWISTTDPLALVAIQAGQVPTPASEQGAASDSKLDVPQRAIQIGEPVPIVFARRRNNQGGILVSPGATEARFENNASNEVRAYYHLVISEGQIDSIAVKDVFQRACRVGTHTQTYNRRAGTWTPENAITQLTGYTLPEASYYCGTIGNYPNMSTLSFTSAYIPDGFDQWNRQVHLFIRGGIHVLRFEDNIEGPSDSFADLVRWLFTNSARVPADLIDLDALENADLFLRANGFSCNCWLQESQNLVDFLSQWGPYFLLGQSNNSGKKGLRPILPTTANGTINTETIVPLFTFDEDTILPGTFEIQYTSLSDRQPFVAQMIWRQQLEDDFGIIRTAEVRIDGTAETGPYESHDLSEFCTSETHAVKIGAYLIAKRYYTTHTIRFSAKPGDYGATLTAGDIIRVRLLRRSINSTLGYHDYFYQIERITQTLTGEIEYECTHFPVDEQNRSLVANAMLLTTGTGILLESVKSGVSCDVNSSSDNTVPAEQYTEPSDEDEKSSVPRDEPDRGNTGGQSQPSVGDQLTANTTLGDGCAITVAWYSVDPQTGSTILRKSSTISPGGNLSESNYTVAPEDQGLEIYSTYFKTCPGDTEPSTDQTSYGTVKPTAPQNTYKYFRFNGTQKLRDGTSGAIASDWYLTDWYIGGMSKKSVVTPWGTSAEAFVSDYVTPPGCAVTYDPIPVIQTKLGYIVFSVVGSRASGCYGPPTYSSNNFLKSVSGKWEFSNDKSTIGKTIG